MTNQLLEDESHPPSGTVVKLCGADVDEVASIHMSSWAADELSVVLGPRFVRRYYHTVVHAPSAFGYGYRLGDEFIAYATGFWDYDQFFSDLVRGNRVMLAALVLSKLATARLALSDLLNTFQDRHTHRTLTFPTSHQNGLALRNEYKGTPVGRLAITAVIERVLEAFRQAGVKGCWGRTRAQNHQMRSYYKKLGFEEVTPSVTHRLRYAFFEKAFMSEDS